MALIPVNIGPHHTVAYSTMSGHTFISAPCLHTFTPERHLLPPPANKDDFEKGNDDDPKDDPVVQ